MNADERRRKLNEFVAAWRGRAHIYGVNDCALFCASWVAVLHGVDPAADLRGTYSTAAEADALVDRFGGMEAAVEGALERAGIKVDRFVGPMLARDGDILLGLLPTAWDSARREVTDRQPTLGLAHGASVLVPTDGSVDPYRREWFAGGWHV